MSERALIGLGSNLGDRRALLDSAVATLSKTPEITVLAVSSYHETAPVGGPIGQGPFLNAAVALQTTLAAEAILFCLNAIEHEAQRVRTIRWGERTLDLDLLLLGDRVIKTPRLQVPHPRMALRRFVLAPLSEIAPEAVDPETRRSVRDLLENLDRRPSYIAIACPPQVDQRTIFEAAESGLSSRHLIKISRSFISESISLSKRLCKELPAMSIEERIAPEQLKQRADEFLADRTGRTTQELSSTLQAWFHLNPLHTTWLTKEPSLSSLHGNSWIVSPFWFDAQYLVFDSLKAIRPRMSEFHEVFLKDRSAALQPTFVVARPEDLERYGLRNPRFDWQWPIGRDTPILEVTDFESDETFGEVLATCAGTRPV